MKGKTTQAVLIIGGALAFILLMWWGHRWATQGLDSADEVWAQVAAARGGTFRPSDGATLNPTTPTLRWVSGSGATVVLDTYTRGTGESTRWLTRARAAFATGAGPSFDVRAKGLLGRVATAAGGQDVELGGGSAFDDAFRVRCQDADATRRAWTEAAQRNLLEHLPDATVESDGREITIVLEGELREPAQVEAMLDVAAELGRPPER